MKIILTNLFCYVLTTISLSSSAQTIIQYWATLNAQSTPYDITIDPSGYVYTTNIDNNTISKISPNGTVQTLSLNTYPISIAADGLGNVFVVNNNNTISKITPAGTIIEVWATLASNAYPKPDGMVIDASGNIFTANAGNSTISKITAYGTVTEVWATLASNAGPAGIAIDATGNIFTTNNNNTVSKITAGGTVTESFAVLRVNAYPHGIVIDPSGNIITANSGDNTVSKITPDGTVTQVWGTLAGDAYPSGIVADPSGNIYTANYNNTVSKITPGGTVTQAYVTLLSNNQDPLNAHPINLAIDAWNNIFTANRYANSVSKIITSVQTGAALNFDGINDYISIPHNALLKPASAITIEAWIKPIFIHFNPYYEIYRKEDGNDRHLLSFQNNGTVLSFGLSIANVYSELDVPIVAADYENQWVHIAATFDGTKRKIYRNGVLIGSENITGTIGTSGTAPAYIGCNSGTGEFFIGNMDEFSLWNRALTQEEIQNNLNCEINPASQSGLIALYHFNQGTEGQPNPGGSTLLDAGGSHLNGTLANFSLNGFSSNWIAWGGVQSGLSCSVGISLCPSDQFSITSDITGSTYQWQYRLPNASEWIDLSSIPTDYFYPSAQTPTLSKDHMDSWWAGSQFRCKVDGNHYSSVYKISFRSQWTGTVSDAWSNPANWSCGVVPDSYTDVVINSGTVMVDVNAICSSLYIKPGVIFTLGPNGTLNVIHP